MNGSDVPLNVLSLSLNSLGTLFQFSLVMNSSTPLMSLMSNSPLLLLSSEPHIWIHISFISWLWKGMVMIASSAWEDKSFCFFLAVFPMNDSFSNGLSTFSVFSTSVYKLKIYSSKAGMTLSFKCWYL